MTTRQDTPDGATPTTGFDRPGFNQLVGHAQPRSLFRRTLARRRLASTYLFVGPEGVGKRTFAEALAGVLLCGQTDPATLTRCGRCESCRLFEAGAHPDLLRVGLPEGRASLPISLLVGPPDKRRQEGLVHDLGLRPLAADRRVAIIDDADTLGVESGNCLLKTLEEPPAGSLLILIGTSVARQLPTIRSRSQVVRFAPLADDEVRCVLVGPAIGLAEEEAGRLAPLGAGSVGAALAAREDDANEAARAVVGLVAAPGTDPVRLAKALDGAIKEAGTEPAARRRRLTALLAALVGHYRAGLRGAALSGGQPSGRSLDALEACLAAERALGRNANVAAVVDVLAGRLAAPTVGGGVGV